MKFEKIKDNRGKKKIKSYLRDDFDSSWL